MKVYLAVQDVAYEGRGLLGVYATREEAMQRLTAHDGYKAGWSPYSFGVLEAEVGQALDILADVDWLE